MSRDSRLHQRTLVCTSSEGRRHLKVELRNEHCTIYTIICLKSVDVRKLQVAILARSPREMSQTDRILPRYILSRVRVSVRPRIFFFTRKEPKPDSPACCLFQVVYGSALRPDKQLNWKLQNRPSWVASR